MPLTRRLILYFDHSFGNSVSQDDQPLTVNEGSASSIINCKYSTSYSSYYLFWYRQYPQKPLEFLIRKYSDGSEHKSNSADRRFSSDLNTSQKKFTLTIKDLQLSDSAVYYCGLWEA
uniref:Ig-like domain-containing protein n=1 Tax=Latimeria chalumnae TaxID=7897 RepID=H3AKI0_LATCH